MGRNFQRTRGLFDCGHELALVVRNLSLIRFVRPLVVCLARPEALVDFIARDKFFGRSGQGEQKIEGDGLQRDGDGLVEEELLSFINENNRCICN